MKRGINTTEFWLSSIVLVTGIIASIANPEQFGKIGIIISTVSTAVYTIGRTFIKKTNGAKE
jgi:hypothetical protein